MLVGGIANYSVAPVSPRGEVPQAINVSVHLAAESCSGTTKRTEQPRVARHGGGYSSRVQDAHEMLRR